MTFQTTENDSATAPEKSIFLLDRGNIGFITGKHKKLASRTWMLLALGILTMFLAVYSGVGLLNRSSRDNALNNRGIKSSGVIREVRSEISTRGTVTYYVDYVYETQDGMEYHGSVQVGLAYYTTTNISDRIEILYDPDQPGVHKVAGAQFNSPPKTTDYALVGGVFVIAIGLIGAWAYEYARQRRLIRDGKLVEGQIRLADTRWRRQDLLLTIEYDFTAPDTNRSVVAKATARRNDMRLRANMFNKEEDWKLISGRGARVNVLYADQNNYRLL